MSTWIQIGVQGTERVINLKTSLKSLRTTHTFALKKLQTEQGIFLESIARVGEGDQLPAFQNGLLNKVSIALTKVEAVFEKVSANLVELVGLLSELQTRDEMEPAHIQELKNDETAQRANYEKRDSDNTTAVTEAVKLMAKWGYGTAPAASPSTPDSAPAIAVATTAQPSQPQRRRFHAVDGFKPKMLGLETSYEDWIDFQKRFQSLSILKLTENANQFHQVC